jgi:predicted transcriptional regulator
MGYKLTLELPDEVYQSLVRRAKETSQSPDAFAAEVLAAVTRQAEEDPLEQFIGAFDSRGSDWADRHDQHLGEAMIRATRAK